MQNFSELTVSSSLKERLLAARFTIPTPVQAAAIPQAKARTCWPPRNRYRQDLAF
jgi:superfamily II DNA/RNA helicase